ncbi:hypothetical protein NKI39_25285, partial [Mesorhizobium sp. M0664]|uniref:hypothetical protein n=1 Tax=Mesorhizobium sp. M0664 TaxID=2956982 RepID=UPI00333D2A9E
HRAKVALKAGNGSRSFAQLPLQRILSQPKLNPKIAICDSPALKWEIGSFDVPPSFFSHSPIKRG